MPREEQLELTGTDFIGLHGLDLIVDPPKPVKMFGAGFVGERAVRIRRAKVQVVHVIDPRAGGEDRVYVLDEERKLRLRGPCYSGPCRLLDEAVAKRLDATIVPYVVVDGGLVLEIPEAFRG